MRLVPLSTTREHVGAHTRDVPWRSLHTFDIFVLSFVACVWWQGYGKQKKPAKEKASKEASQE